MATEHEARPDTPAAREPAPPAAGSGGIGVRTARRVAVAVVGASIVIVGVLMLVLPGPGVVTILAGLGILSLEFAFARRWVAYIQARSSEAADRAAIPKRWRWAFPVTACLIGLGAMAAPVFLSFIYGSHGLSVVVKPHASTRFGLTSADTLAREAAGGDAAAQAILERFSQRNIVAKP